MRRMDEGRGARSTGRVPQGLRPSEARAAAAARLVGAAAGPESVRTRMAVAARRGQEAASRAPVTRLASRRSGRPAGPGARTAGPGPRSGGPGARTSGPGRAPAMVNPSAHAGPVAAATLAVPHAEPRREHEARPRHLKVVRPGTLSATQRRRRARAVLIATIAAGSIIAFALVYLHVVLAQRQFRIDNLNSQVGRAQTSYQNLRLQVAELGSPQHIISTAEGQLGMVQPSKVVYLTPKPSSSGPTGPRGGSASSVTKTAASGQAPSGDANWPTIKSQLAGTP